MVLKLLAKIFARQKIESVNFPSCYQAKLSPRLLSIPIRQKKTTHSSQKAFSEDVFFPGQKEEKDYGAENKIKPK